MLSSLDLRDSLGQPANRATRAPGVHVAGQTKTACDTRTTCLFAGHRQWRGWPCGLCSGKAHCEALTPTLASRPQTQQQLSVSSRLSTYKTVASLSGVLEVHSCARKAKRHNSCISLAHLLSRQNKNPHLAADDRARISSSAIKRNEMSSVCPQTQVKDRQAPTAHCA